MKGMKIKVETDEHGEANLDEIVVELERMGLFWVCILCTHW